MMHCAIAMGIISDINKKPIMNATNKTIYPHFGIYMGFSCKMENHNLRLRI